MSKSYKREILKRLRPGDIFEMAVYDCFEGRFKLLKKSLGKIYVEVVDVCMCYPQQVQSEPGEKYWIEEEEEIAEIKGEKMIKTKDIKPGAKFIGTRNAAIFEVVEIKRVLHVFSPRVIIKDINTGITVPCGLKSFAMCNVMQIAISQR